MKAEKGIKQVCALSRRTRGRATRARLRGGRGGEAVKGRRWRGSRSAGAAAGLTRCSIAVCDSLNRADVCSEQDTVKGWRATLEASQVGLVVCPWCGLALRRMGWMSSLVGAGVSLVRPTALPQLAVQVRDPNTSPPVALAEGPLTVQPPAPALAIKVAVDLDGAAEFVRPCPGRA